MTNLFKNFAHWCADAMGRPWAFVLSVLSCVVWAATGPIFDYSDTWQLVINTATTVVTFLMIFLVQNTQNRDALAVQLKLDELIRASNAKNAMINLDDLTDEQLRQLRDRYNALGKDEVVDLIDKELKT